MDTVSSLTAQLQLKYPALKTAEDVIMLLRCQIPAKFMERIRRDVGIARQKVEDGKTYTSVPGMLLVEFSRVVGTLKLFAIGIEKSFGCEAVFVGKMVELYGEERTPDKRIITGSGYGGTSGLADAFMASMEKFFETHTMTVSLVFACICWIRAVAALQGDLGLGRNVSLTYSHLADLMRILEANVENNTWLTEDVGAREHVRRFVDRLKKRNHGYCISRRNPLLAGFVLLDNDLEFLKISHQVGRVSWILRAFGHLYNALVNEGFLENIPFFDEVLAVYEQVIFVPSQAAATRGSYNRTYLLSCDWTPAAIRAKYEGTSRRSADLYKMSKKFRLDNVSKICSLLGKDGKLFMKSSSSKTMLFNVADVCSKELFQTRVLSRDMLTLNGDLTETFHAIYAALGALSHDDHDAENMDHSGPEAFPRARRCDEDSADFGRVAARWHNDAKRTTH
ncbi:hypothetical protein PF005_g29065 [Phytophthora fragariae]|uniref:Uncharacterized protein n=1 Tax=Phytophthora fragariae TaxID=53985 RepID=A0A6A3VG00_9STRA|nr:hypothetical protein PF005_g29065 [Phytophthora fragariae]